MHTPAKLGLYGLGLAAVFGAAFLVAGAIVPPSAVESHAEAADDAAGAHGGHAPRTQPRAEGDAAADALPGLSLAAGGFELGAIAAPHRTGAGGELSFSILDTHGEAVTEFTETHEKDLHLIVVRNDGTEFRHVHPALGADGTWSLPWTWEEAGTYRVFADFTPTAGGEQLTLSRTIDVGGDFEPASGGADVREAAVGGFDVRLTGDLVAGGPSTLALEVTRDGAPVTDLQPYLGAFGHLVVLRDGDLAYLHAHPEGEAPEPGDRSGPAVEFATETPTAGRYLLYFDFRVGDEVHSAPFVLTTSEGGAAEGGIPEGDHDDSH